MLLILLPLGGYLLGSVSSAVLVSKLMELPDPRQSGSGNPGATNVLRLGNKSAAALTLLGDVLKGALPVLIAKYLDADTTGIALAGLGAFLGHLFPVFFGFAGGKGVATTMGGLLAIMPMVMLMGIVAWLIIFYTLRIVSVASIAFGLVLPFAAWGLQSWRPELFVNILGKSVTGLAELVFAILISVLILVRHRANITRLLRGEELFFKKKD